MPIAPTTINATKVTSVDEWSGKPWIRFRIGLEISQIINTVGSIHLLDFQKAAPQNKRATIGEKLARLG